MPADLITEIKTARQLLREEEERTHDAAIELQNCKSRERKARGELDAILDALESGGLGRTEDGRMRTEENSSSALLLPPSALPPEPHDPRPTPHDSRGRGEKGAVP